MAPLPYDFFLPPLVLLTAIAAYEAARGRAGLLSRVVLATLALCAFIEAATVAYDMTEVSLSMVSYRWKAFGLAFLVFISASTVAVAEWLRLYGRWRWLATYASFTGGALAWHLVTELV